MELFQNNLQFSTDAEMIMHLALRVVATDDSMKCYCGSTPYLDGDLCPKCLCIETLEEVEPLLKKVTK
jgi:hypothetical protein